jgi:hypothetical protein
VKASEICHKAGALVSGDRAASHGDMGETYGRVAAYWSAYTGATLNACDVLSMLELMKIGRRQFGAHNIDDYIDGAGYAGCAGEIAERMQPAAERHDPIAAFRETWRGGPLFNDFDWETGARMLRDAAGKVLVRVEPE